MMGRWPRSRRRSRPCSPAPSAARRPRSGRVGVPSVATGTRWSRSWSADPPTSHSSRSAPTNRSGPARIGEIRTDTARPISTGIDELDTVLGGGLVCRFGHPARRRTRHRQEHAAAPAPRRPCRHDAVRERRGERHPGAPARRTARRDPSRPVAPRRDLAPPRHPGDRRDQPAIGRDRLDPDDGRPRSVIGTRIGRPGPRLRTPPGQRSEGAQHRDRARRTRHEGRQPRRATRPRTRRRHRAPIRGDRHHALRLLRAVKHRFGPTNELGLFEMVGAGLVAVPDPSTMFLADRRTGIPGSAVVPTMEGRRPIVVELQALTSPGLENVPEAPECAGHRRQSTVDADGRARPARTHQGRRAGRLRIRCRRREADRTGPRSRHLPCRGERDARHRRSRPTWPCSAKSGSAAKSARSVTRPRRVTEAARLGFRRIIVPAKSPEPDDELAGVAPAPGLDPRRRAPRGRPESLRSTPPGRAPEARTTSESDLRRCCRYVRRHDR